MMRLFGRKTRRREPNALRALVSRAVPSRPRRRTVRRLAADAVRPIVWLFRQWMVIVPTLALAGIYWAVFNFSVFDVQVIEVRGVEGGRAAEVAAAAAVTGANIFRIDEGEVRQRITDDALVRVDLLQRRVPNELIVEVRDRMPVAVWEAGGERFLVDAEGLVLGPAPEGVDLITIRQTDDVTIERGQYVSADAIYLAGELEQQTAEAVGARPAVFEWSQDGGMYLRTDQGWHVRLGTSDDLEYKLRVWRVILDRAGAERFSATHVDVRFPTRPYVRGG